MTGRKRTRMYTVYATAPGGSFTSQGAAYSRGTHEWIYTIRATSIRQAYFLAAREIFAGDAGDVGVHRIEHACWHHGCRDRGPAHRPPGHYRVAPHITTQRGAP